ncbi:M10 family metallopeptidase C-terminal domain-containing protein [Microvirga calopogonii]|uniref:M10 family metallopeptidase C-terminal domain-containing protein n=1 Tax=Microvirga calopogonii TaxID=2078013 RepID=UPI000E0D2EA5|nr:M10 family metallopeptidase C-terminal domain-containing protein [Microvirga calopogonii]
MPAVVTAVPTGDAYIDGVLGDVKWAVNGFTYSFPASASFYGTPYGGGETANAFGALTPTQQATVRAALTMYASVANLTFTEMAETATRHADLRFAMSNTPGTAWAYFPTTNAEGGDAWFNRTDYNSPAKGNYAYLTFVHEIGHTLGLEHPHESGMPGDRDSIEYTVMSYRSYVGASTTSGYTNETWGYAQSPMMYDIAALQHLYGANYATNSGNTVYAWSPTTGEMFINGVGQGAPGGNKILQTVWDGGGTDTYDFSNYATGVTIDLRPGSWTTTASTQLAKLHWDGSKTAAGNIANALLYNNDARSLIENAKGGSGDDIIVGNAAANTLWGGAGNDRLSGGAGNDTLDGGAGIDTALFSGLRASYDIRHQSNGSVLVTDLRAGMPDGTDQTWGVEYFQFGDGLFASADLNASTNLTLRTVVSALKVAFNPQVYLQANPDVAAAGVNPLEHYVRFGASEGRAGAGVNPGQSVGRSITKGFDADYYLMNNPDVARAGVNPLEHYNSSGWKEGRDPSAAFDTSYYLEHYQDVAAAHINPLDHYFSFGWKEGRDTSTSFDTSSYLTANPDVAAAGVNPLQHFLENGIYEGRVAWDVIA